jgi:hypothetical protein
MVRVIGLSGLEVTDAEAGTPVFISDGPLHGLRGTILESVSDDRLIVMVQLRYEITALEFPACWVRIDDGVTNPPQPVTH